MGEGMLVFNRNALVYYNKLTWKLSYFVLFKSCCGTENSMKRFGDKDKKAADECYGTVAEKFSTASGKYSFFYTKISI